MSRTAHVDAVAAVLAAVLAATGCSGGKGSAGDGGPVNDGAGIYELGLDLPPGCPPSAGNEKGVGIPCTKNGNECKSGMRCSCDAILGALLVGVPCFCTLAQFAQNGSKDPCKDSVPSSYCGSNATCCDYMNAAAYCVPSICLPGNQCLVFDGGT
jgi:hypothetical protein